jgi:hypothetical protein
MAPFRDRALLKGVEFSTRKLPDLTKVVNPEGIGRFSPQLPPKLPGKFGKIVFPALEMRSKKLV